MASQRRVGAETSKTRDRVLDSVERLMVKDGYAAVTYRAVAAKAGVTSGLVQYYFPALDDIFVAAIRRRSEQNLARLDAALRARPEQPLRVLWEYSQEESTAALTTEFLALGNHRKSIRAEIAEFTDRVRELQLDALRSSGVKDLPGLGDLSIEVLLFVLTGVPKLLRLEEGVGVSGSHRATVDAFAQLLDAAEPTQRGSDVAGLPSRKKSTPRRYAPKR